MENINYECPICCHDYDTTHTKYKCTQCHYKICDSCFTTIVNKRKKCVFCRGELDINEQDLRDIDFRSVVSIPGGYVVFYNKYKCILITLIFIFILWYIFLLVFLFSAHKII